MPRQPAINIKVTGLNTEADRNRFAKKCSEFWMNIISDTVSELPIGHNQKLEFVKGVVSEIHEKIKEVPNNGKSEGFQQINT